MSQTLFDEVLLFVKLTRSIATFEATTHTELLSHHAIDLYLKSRLEEIVPPKLKFIPVYFLPILYENCDSSCPLFSRVSRVLQEGHD